MISTHMQKPGEPAELEGGFGISGCFSLLFIEGEKPKEVETNKRPLES